MEVNTSFLRLAFEPLIDGMRGGPPLNNPIGSALSLGLGDGIVRMNQVNGAERGGFERRAIQAPSLELVKEVLVHAPVLEGLKVTVETRSRIFSHIVNMDLFSCFRQHNGGRQTRKPSAHDVDR